MLINNIPEFSTIKLLMSGGEKDHKINHGIVTISLHSFYGKTAT